MKTVNNQVAVQELKPVKGPVKEVRGLDLDDGQTSTLIPSKVLLESGKYKIGTILYFRADIVRLPQARTKFRLNDVEFVLIPEDAVIAFDDSQCGKD